MLFGTVSHEVAKHVNRPVITLKELSRFKILC